jgi:hypothetical protein
LRGNAGAKECCQAETGQLADQAVVEHILLLRLN